MWYLVLAESHRVGSDWASAQILASQAATLAESQMSSIVVSGMAG